MAIAAAVLSAGSMGVAVWQTKSAKRSADVAEDDLAESRKQTVAAEQAAAAAEQQVAEARRQNEITEEQLHLAREELKIGRERDQQKQVARHVAAVPEVLIAADALREELHGDAAAIIEYQDRARSSVGFTPLLPIFGRAESEWDAAVNKNRVDKPPSPELTTAINTYDQYAKVASKAVENAQGKAIDQQLSSATAAALVSLVDRSVDQYKALKRACDEFFTVNRVDPGDLTAH
ncbi:hypothetical protein ILP97_25100 [Amycolatopsis sp. H6(2020)]|nr:hypothetical protein [Amycolatopsis sp. H6(2020)]